MHKPKFYIGWIRGVLRIGLFLSFVKYLVRHSQYPLFRLRASQHGMLEMFRLERDLQLNKTVLFNGKIYTGLTVPGYPSKAFEHMVANGGFNFAASGTKLKPRADNVILAITRSCNYKCLHCYEKHNIHTLGADQGEDIPIERWKSVIADIQRNGISIIILSGGEPMLRFNGVLDLLTSGNIDLSDFHLHTSGSGVTRERAEMLKEAGLTAAAVGLDDVNPDRYNHLRGYPGAFDQAVNALRCFNEAGIMTYLNTCVTKEMASSGDLWQLFALAKELNVSFIQLLEPRPFGGYNAHPIEQLWTERERKILTDFYLRGNNDPRYRDYPILYYVAYIEHADRMGCMMGGLSHFAIDSAGNVNPCVFVPVSFGNILQEDFTAIYTRMRSATPHPLHAGCGSIYMSGAIHAAEKRTNAMPVRYDDVKEEWDGAYANDSRSRPQAI
jgi:MoaA/NifB/PqqE/SkfB family radical SAM enzyme